MSKQKPALRASELSRSATSVALILLCVAFAQNVLANTSVSTTAYTNSNPYGVLTDTHSLNGASGVAVQTSAYMSNGGPIYSSVAPFPAVGSQYGEASAFAYAAEGLLRASGTATAGVPGIVQNAMATQAFSRASWNDGLTINAAGLYGQPGYITALMAVSGTFGGNIGPSGPRADPFVDVAVRMLGTGMPANTDTIPSILSGACGGWAFCGRQYSGFGYFAGGFGYDTATYSNIPSTILLTIPVYFGRETSLGYTLDLYVYPHASGFADGPGTSADGYVDFSHTLSWGGITGVFDAGGNPISNFTAASTSGFDYLNPSPVPEPAVTWLLGFGLLALLGIVRRRG